MKKIYNVILIASVLALGSNFAFAKKAKVNDELIASKKEKEIQIIEPEKEVKVNHKKEIKNLNLTKDQRFHLLKKQKECMKQNSLQ